MGKSKNTLTLSLMTGSIILVLVLQGFWLKSSYKEASERFNKETGFLFRTTVMGLQDSLLRENIEVIDADTTFSRFNNDRVARYFVLREADSLHIQDIEREYQTALEEANIHIPFQVVKVSSDTLMSGPEGRFPPLKGNFRAEGIRAFYIETNESHRMEDEAVRDQDRMNRERKLLPPLVRGSMPEAGQVFLPQTGLLSAEFDSSAYRWLLLGELSPQLLFSLVMVLFISISFYFMYRSLRMQQRLMLLKNDFVSNVTHELKTPVATASVAIESLRNFQTLKDPKRTQDYLEIAQHQLNRLTLLTDNILKAAVFESKGIDLQIESINLKALIDQVLASMKLVFEKKGAVVSFQTEGEDFQAEGGKVHLSNICYNLIDNALKYSDGQPNFIIELKSLREGFLLTFRDKGPGIPQEFHKKVFEKFFRVPSGNVHNIKGHGLGLNYVAGVVKSHRGTIRLDSQPGKGSSFIIYLPRYYAKNQSTLHRG